MITKHAQCVKRNNLINYPTVSMPTLTLTLSCNPNLILLYLLFRSIFRLYAKKTHFLIFFSGKKKKVEKKNRENRVFFL